MRYLLDTCTFLWWMIDPSELSASALAVIVNPQAEIYVSSVSIWEIEVKTSLGRLPQVANLKALIDADFEFERFVVLDLSRAHAHELPGLPHHHKDPFDRMLICQALHEGLDILTPDRLFKAYPVKVHW